MAEGFTRVDTTQNILCRYFIHGACRLGDNCAFSHDSHGTQLSSACRYYLKGTCTYGEKCRYDHIKPERLDSMRRDLHSENHHERSRPVAPTALSSRSTEKVKSGEKKYITLSGSFSKLCADAPEFVPRLSQSYNLPTNAVSEVVSYAKAAGGQDKNEQILSPLSLNESEQSLTEGDLDISAELCPFFLFSGQCRLGDSCNYIHGLVCEFCQMACLHPTNQEQRDKHVQECMKDIENEMTRSFAIARSKEKQCGICMETVWERSLSAEQRFGILPNCSHCYCLDCIRKWRQSKQFENKIIRSCPECRTQSDYIIPSRYWVDDKEKEEKGKLLQEYKSALGLKHCKYFKQGKGSCPFGNKCFYQHVLPDGTPKDVGPPKKKKVVLDRNEMHMQLQQNMILWEFLDSRDDRLADIQLSLENILRDYTPDEIIELITPTDDFDTDSDSD